MEKQIEQLRDRGALFVINHSGGKDSQAMTIKIKSLVSKRQILIIHADLPEADWEGCYDLVQETNRGYDVIQVVAGKTLLSMAEKRGMWPAPKYRQCTSDLKRDPINKAIRHYIKDNNHSGLIVNCMGLRAEESSSRAKAQVFKLNKRNSKAGREWYDWLPIHHWSTVRVFQEIKDAGEQPHWAYSQGMERLSCCFCIMASRNDLTVAARLNPSLYKKYVEMEKKINFTLVMPKKNQDPVFLEEYTGIQAN
jgi:3'-phosphoadenosine 5'-phosphosulfate sulfotransferase (PAPS reductase)/FAD synthetase